MDYTNIPTGLKIQSQIPLDTKAFVKSEIEISTLGVDDNLAFTYHEGLQILCIEEKRIYEWREVQPGEENTGLLTLDFTYPSNLPDSYGIDYSNRTFNFFQVTPISIEEIEQMLEDYVLQIDLPEYSCMNIAVDGGPNEGEYTYAPIYYETITTGNDKSFRFSGIAVPIESALQLTGYSYNTGIGEGNVRTTNVISFVPYLEDSSTSTIYGDGSFLSPLKVETLNPQKEISEFPYTLLPEDDKYTLFINNAINNVIINVPDTLTDNFTCAFIQEGIGDVTINATGVVNLLYPNTVLQNKIKGQNFSCMIERKLSTNNYHLIGNLKPV
jgi:hypothetical protein